MAETAALKPAQCAFESRCPDHAHVAQLAEVTVREAVKCPFESDHAHQFCPSRPTAGVVTLRT